MEEQLLLRNQLEEAYLVVNHNNKQPAAAFLELQLNLQPEAAYSEIQLR